MVVNGKLLLGKTYSGARFRAILALLFFFLKVINTKIQTNTNVKFYFED